jgi:2-oxo-4-hydroxy-4-carboxy-5-ureidoimidazoline decarboxylase
VTGGPDPGPDSAPKPAPAAGLAIARLDELDDAACAAALAPLFEGAPAFLARLCAARPFGSAGGLFEQARAIAHAMPEAEQLELIDAHPRLGAPPETVSRLSHAEQGYDRAGSGAGDPAGAEVARELERLNDAYEARFGFRYCVFVAGRSRAALLPGFEAALDAERGAEVTRAVDAVVDIAADRLRRALAPGG